MNTSKQERKQQALEMMKELDIYEPYIEGFKKADDICYFENYAGFWAWQDDELKNKIKEIEKNHNCTVYTITHEYTEFGECYDFLIITDYKEEWTDLVTEVKNNEHYAFAYVWNKTDNDCSEFGTIGVKNFGGGIKRIY